MTAEEWRVVPGYDKYEVSNLGRVRSNVRPGAPRLLVATLAGRRREYPYVSVGRDNKGVHVLVAAAFLGAKPAGHEVRHLNGKPQDNRPENLAYGTRSENMRDTFRHETNFEKNKTHCKRGHEFPAENTLERISRRTGLPSRACRTCVNAQQREWMKQYRLRKKEANA